MEFCCLIIFYVGCHVIFLFLIISSFVDNRFYESSCDNGTLSNIESSNICIELVGYNFTSNNTLVEYFVVEKPGESLDERCVVGIVSAILSELFLIIINIIEVVDYVRSRRPRIIQEMELHV